MGGAGVREGDKQDQNALLKVIKKVFQKHNKSCVIKTKPHSIGVIDSLFKRGG